MLKVRLWVVHYLVQLSHHSVELGLLLILGDGYEEFAQAPCDPVDFCWVLSFSPTSHKCAGRWIGCTKLTCGINKHQLSKLKGKWGKINWQRSVEIRGKRMGLVGFFDVPNRLFVFYTQFVFRLVSQSACKSFNTWAPGEISEGDNILQHSSEFSVNCFSKL